MDHAAHSHMVILTEPCLLRVLCNEIQKLSAVREPFLVQYWMSHGLPTFLEESTGRHGFSRSD